MVFLKVFFNFKENGENVDIFNRNYPDHRSYNKQCDLYYIGKNIGTPEELKLNKNTNEWTTDDNNCSYYFTSGNIVKPTEADIGCKKETIKNLINNDLIFPLTGLNTFIIDDLSDYLSGDYLTGFVSGTVSEVEQTISSFMSGVVFNVPQTYPIPNIEYQELSSTVSAGITFYDGKVDNKIGYIFGLQIKDNQADILNVPAVRYYTDIKKTPLFTFNNSFDLFDKVYPEIKSYEKKCKIYFITKNNMYFNCKTKSWSTNKSKATYFFTEQNATNKAEQFRQIVGEDAITGDISIKIKYLVADARLDFPIKAGQGFELIDIDEYLEN